MGPIFPTMQPHPGQEHRYQWAVTILMFLFSYNSPKALMRKSNSEGAWALLSSKTSVHGLQEKNMPKYIIDSHLQTKSRLHGLCLCCSPLKMSRNSTQLSTITNVVFSYYQGWFLSALLTWILNTFSFKLFLETGQVFLARYPLPLCFSASACSRRHPRLFIKKNLLMSGFRVIFNWSLNRKLRL